MNGSSFIPSRRSTTTSCTHVSDCELESESKFAIIASSMTRRRMHLPRDQRFLNTEALSRVHENKDASQPSILFSEKFSDRNAVLGMRATPQDSMSKPLSMIDSMILEVANLSSTTNGIDTMYHGQVQSILKFTFPLHFSLLDQPMPNLCMSCSTDQCPIGLREFIQGLQQCVHSRNVWPHLMNDSKDSRESFNP